jgi:hypothetical protein
MAGSNRRELLSWLRFPRAMPSLVGYVLLIPLLLLFTRRGGSDVSGLGGLAGEILVACGTLALAVIVILLPLVLLFRPSPALAWIYPWMALAIVAGNTALWLIGYWRKAAELHDVHYLLAPWIAWTSVAALIPTCIGQLLHYLHSRNR